jgi:hypothetical protein
MNKIEKQDLEEILLDVRKAYRLLFLYQERVLSSMKYIKQVLKLNEPKGHACTSYPIKQDTYMLSNWAWDWLAMYNYEFSFNVIPNTSTNLSIVVVSDSGLFEKNEIHNGVDSKVLDINSYAIPKESDTLVVFFVSTNKETLWYDKSLVSLDFKTKSFRKGSKSYFKTNDAGDKFFSMSFSMSEFIDKAGIEDIVDKFVAGCKEKGIDIKPETKQVTAT